MLRKIWKIFSLFVVYLFLFSNPAFGQFVENPDITPPANNPTIESTGELTLVFDFLILISALIFLISIFGFILGFIKIIGAGGDEFTAIKGKDMLVMSSWLMGSAIIGYLIINLVKHFW